MDIQRWDRAKQKIGNTFELTVLIQKRVRELVKEKQRPLVDYTHRNPIQIALEEILQDKIYLAPPPAPLRASSEESVDAIPELSTEALSEAVAPLQDPTIDPTAPPSVLDTEDLTGESKQQPVSS